MKTNNIKVAIFVLGGAIKFVKKNLKRADGTNEYYKLIKSLCSNPQISEVLIIQKSDWGKLDMFEKQGLLVKDGNRLKYINSAGEETKEYRKNWTGELLDKVMKDYAEKDNSVVNSHQVQPTAD